MTSLCRRWGLLAAVCGLAGCPSSSPPDAGLDAGCSGCDLTGCAIGGVIYDAGVYNPAAVCQVCAPPSSLTGWTNVLDGTLCDAGSVCASGQCLPGCFIDGFYAAADGGNPDDSCELCDPAQSLSAWTIVGADGTPCTGDGGNFCMQGICVSECAIGGAYYPAGSANAQQSCLSCEPSVDPTAWTPLPDTSACEQDGGYLCLSGACVAGCAIDGGVVPPGTPSLESPCFGCQPQVSPLGDTQLPDGTPCTTGTGGTVCQGGACISACSIGGVFYPNGTVDAGNPNVCCNGAASATSWSPGFGAAVSLSTAVEPDAIAIGDVNGDQIEDLVVAHEGTGQIGILLGEDGGAFAPEVLISVGAGPRALALADVNGDGLTDIAVVAGGNSSMTVLLQQGDGGLLPAPGSPFATPPAPTGVAISRLAGLGQPPALVVSDDSNGGGVTVWLGSLDGGFQAPISYSVGLQPVGLAVADFEHDSSPDVATVDLGDSTLTLLHNNGPGTFAQPGWTVALPALPSALVAGDFNGDGYPDLAVALEGPDGGMVGIYLNRTVAPWFVATPVLLPVDDFPSAVAAGDFNAAGNVDVAVTCQSEGLVQVLLNETPAKSPLAVFLPPASYGVGKQPTGIAAGTLDGNVNPDLAVANIGSSSVSILSGNCP